MKKYLTILLIALLAFQAIHCQETEEENDVVPEDLEEELGEFEEELGEFEEELGELEEELEELEEELENGAEEEANTEEWNVLDVDQLQAEDEREELYTFGAQYIIAEKIGNHEIANSAWSANVLHNLAYREKDRYVDYRFNVTFIDTSNPDDTFLAQYIVRGAGSNALPNIFSRVLTYTTYISQNTQDDEGNIVERLMKEINQYGNDSTIAQFVAPGTFEPLSDPAVRTDWTSVDFDVWKNDQDLQDWARNATASALQKALNDGTLSGDGWAVGSAYPAVAPEYQGKTYYRYGFNLADDSNFKLAFGDAYVTKDSDGNWEIVTSGIGSIEIQTA